jgi:hypothetical protein
MKSARTNPVLMDPDCLQQWPSHINDTNWHITSACKSNQTSFDPQIFLGALWGAIIFLFLWSIFIAHISNIDTIRRLRRLPSYELHETVEALYEKGLYSTAKKETYKAMWKGRYSSVEYTENRFGHGGKRTITIVEDLNRTPQTETLGLSKIAVQVPDTYRHREVIRDTVALARPAVPASAAPTRSAVAVAAPEPRRDSAWAPENQPPPPYTW